MFDDDFGIMIMLGLAALLGVIPATIASRKGHDFFLWWLFGFALFIIALPYALLVEPDTKAVEEQKVQEGMRKCPFCVEFVKAEALICRYCGHDIQIRIEPQIDSFDQWHRECEVKQQSKKFPPNT